VIRDALAGDAARMAELAERKREQYKGDAPVFHRPKAGARDQHAEFLGTPIADPRAVTLVHETADGRVDGFIVGVLVPPPPVYDPGALTCLVDDFMVESPDLWPTVGAALLARATAVAKPRGAVQSVVVCGPHDVPKTVDGRR
jgi:hypothetical protein